MPIFFGYLYILSVTEHFLQICNRKVITASECGLFCIRNMDDYEYPDFLAGLFEYTTGNASENTTMNLEDLVSQLIDPEETEKRDRFIRLKFYLLSIVIFCGLLFNFLACAVFLQKGMQKTATVIYFFALACADNTVLLGEFLLWLKTETFDHGYIVGVTGIDTNVHACQLNYFLRYFGRLLSSWLVVTICIERFITVTFPLKMARLSTTLKAKVIIGCLILACFIFGSPIFVIFGIIEHFGIKECNVHENHKDLYDKWIMCVIFVGELVVPSIIVLVFTILIISKLHKAKLRRINSKEGQKTEKDRGSRQSTIALLAVSIAFVTLRTPYAIMYPLHLKDHDLFSISQLHNFRNTFNMMYILAVTNYAVNFPLYIVTGQKFRREFVNFIRCRGTEMARRMSRSRSYSFSTNSSSFRRGSDGSVLAHQNTQVVVSDKSSSMSQETPM